MKDRRLSAPMQLSLIFLLFGMVWIIFTDVLLLDIAGERSYLLVRLQTYKGMLFMTISSLFIFFVSRNIFERQRLLQEELNNERLQHRNHLAREILQAQEAERKKVGEDLHDNINQMLGVIKLYIEHAKVNQDARDEMLDRSSDYLLNVISEIRALSRSLVSPALKDFGLIPSIYELADSIGELKQIEITLNLDGCLEDKISDVKKTAVYRVVQEQLNNVLKHSNARSVVIEMKESNMNLLLKITDDGIGFDTLASRPGLGLKNIRHRIELMNGDLSIISSMGKGCTVLARLPL